MRKSRVVGDMRSGTRGRVKDEITVEVAGNLIEGKRTDMTGIAFI